MALKYKILPDVITCRPHQLAWLRRPELDSDGYAIWELPDGQLFACDAKKGEPVIQLLKYPEANNGKTNIETT